MTYRLDQQFGNYRLIRSLGNGGFADVYLGEHKYLNTQAAIKILQTRLTQNTLQTFLAEARTIANLTHQHIVQVLEFGVEQDTPFLVMTYAPNGTLRQCHPNGSRLSLLEVVSYIKQVADALQYAHERRVIHRDVKPENMLVGQNGAILLSDFGIAVVAQSSRYSSQEVGGTAAYMAPEQLQGKAGPASDQYALAVTAYEWLTGERPFSGSFVEICSQHLLTAPTPLRQKVPSLSPAVEQVVLTALNKDPQQRFPNVQAFANALAKASEGKQECSIPVIEGSTPRVEAQVSPVVTPSARPTVSSASSIPTITALQSDNSSPRSIVNPSTVTHTEPPSAGQFLLQGLATQQESRHRSQKRNRGVLIVIVALAVFLVAAVSAGGVSFFTSKKTSSTGGGTTQPAATSQQAGIASGSAGTPTSIPTSTATVAPGATAQPVATVASGMISENLSLTCGTNCNDPIRVTITTIQVNDADGNMIWNITMKNITGSSISYHVSKFELLANGTQNPLPATFSQLYGTLTNNDPYSIQGTFAFVPTQHTTYQLTAVFDENGGTLGGGVTITFDPAQINF